MHFPFAYLAFLAFLLSISTITTVGTSPATAIGDGVGKLTADLTNLRNTLTNASAEISKVAAGFVATAALDSNATAHTVQDNINALRALYVGVAYDRCFPLRPVTTFVDHSVRGVATCVWEIVARPANNAATTLKAIESILATLVGIPHSTLNCKGAPLCLLGLLGNVTVGIPQSVVKVGASVADTVTYLSTLQLTLAPCMVVRAEYPKWAWNCLTNVVSCITDIVTASAHGRK